MTSKTNYSVFQLVQPLEVHSSRSLRALTLPLRCNLRASVAFTNPKDCDWAVLSCSTIEDGRSVGRLRNGTQGTRKLIVVDG